MATDLQKAYSMANVDALFKINYKKYYDETFNSSNAFFGQVDKTNDFTGKRLEFPVPTGYQGGVGSGTLPETNVAPYGDVSIYSKKMYATSKIDRESMMASLDDQGAFVKLITEAVKKTTEADMWNHRRAAFNDGSGSLGTIAANGVTDNTGGNYTIVISDATWKEANWEEGMFCNFGTSTEKFNIETVTPSAQSVVVQRQTGGTAVPTAADVVYLQGSKDNDIYGLKILDATSSTMFGVTVGRRWKAYQIFNYGAAVSPQLLNKLALGVEKQCGKVPGAIYTSYVQYEKFLNQLEDKKRYQMADVKGKGLLSFKGVQFMSSQGPINIFADPFCEDDRLYMVNHDYIKYYRRPNSGWVKEDIGGNGYLRVAGEDAFEARVATYGQLFIALPFHAVVTGLTV